MALDSTLTDYKKELRTSEEQLYNRIQQLMEDKAIFVLSRLRCEDIVELLGTNSTYIADAIRACSPGLSVSKYINCKRVQYARFLIENHPDRSIGEVVELCGFPRAAASTQPSKSSIT